MKNNVDIDCRLAMKNYTELLVNGIKSEKYIFTL